MRNETHTRLEALGRAQYFSLTQNISVRLADTWPNFGVYTLSPALYTSSSCRFFHHLGSRISSHQESQSTTRMHVSSFLSIQHVFIAWCIYGRWFVQDPDNYASSVKRLTLNRLTNFAIKFCTRFLLFLWWNDWNITTSRPAPYALLWLTKDYRRFSMLPQINWAYGYIQQ